MNYLAHLYLSGDDPGIRVGNFIGDHVKGQQFKRYPQPIQTGIILHRHIDTFTDLHPVFRESAALFREGYGLYAGVVADIVYDHLLATNWTDYAQNELGVFVKECYKILIRHYFSLPRRVKQFLPFLITSNRLENYQYFEGIEKTLAIMAGHSSLPSRAEWAILQLESHYDELEEQFHSFFPEMIVSARSFLSEHLHPSASNHPAPAR